MDNAVQAQVQAILAGMTEAKQQTSEETTPVVESTTPETTPSQTKPETEHLFCPRCRFDMETKNAPTPAEDDVREYVRCLLSKRLFTKAYPLFNGEFVLKYSALSQAQAETMGAVLRSLPEGNPVVVATDAFKIKLLFYLHMIHDKKMQEISSQISDQNWRAVYAERFSEYGEDVIVLMTRVLIEFLRLLESLPHAGLDANFWKGAGRS